MRFPSYGLVYDYSLEDGGVSRKHSKDDDDEDQHAGEVRGPVRLFNGGGGERFDLTEGVEGKILHSLWSWFVLLFSLFDTNLCHI